MGRLVEIQPPGIVTDWVPKVLGIQSSNPRLNDLLTTILPVADVFGSELSAQVAFGEVQGALGATEVAHTAPLQQGPNAPRLRLYLSMEYWHDDVAPRQLRAGRILTPSNFTPTIFPFVAMTDSTSIAGDTGAAGGDNRLAVRTFTVGAGDRAAIRADTMGAGARIHLRVAFIEMQAGAYTRGIL